MAKNVLLFSGQGSQYVGMGKELYDNSPAAKAVFDMADSVREGTSRQCFEGTKEELCSTVNTQPCVFAADLAAARAVAEKGIKPDYLAGFSLGEIAALAFSGMLSDEEAFRLVCKRGELMNEAAEKNKGAMLAVMKLPADKIEEICLKFENTYPVNYNSPAQTVVATKEENVDALIEEFSAVKGRAKRLSVSGAFHSPFMSEAAEGLMEYMKSVEFKAPEIPVYSNYTAKPYEGDYKALIKAQVENPVRWQTIVENLASQGVDTIIEVGVGKTLTALTGRINKDIKAVKVENLSDLEALKV
jgi:[acyl-carrier-protein] S-malonyltransferase